MIMKYTFPITKDMVCAKTSLPISRIHANTICRAINRKYYPKAKDIVTNLAEEKKPLNRRYHTKTAKEILNFFKTVEANAVAKNADIEKMRLYISVHRGPTLYRARRKWTFGRQMKICNIPAVLKGEKNGTGKSVREPSNKKTTY